MGYKYSQNGLNKGTFFFIWEFNLLAEVTNFQVNEIGCIKKGQLKLGNGFPYDQNSRFVCCNPKIFIKKIIIKKVGFVCWHEFCSVSLLVSTVSSWSLIPDMSDGSMICQSIVRFRNSKPIINVFDSHLLNNSSRRRGGCWTRTLEFCRVSWWWLKI